MRRAVLLAAILAAAPAASAHASGGAVPTYSNSRCAVGHARAPAAPGFAIPRLTGRVVDNAGILSTEVRRSLAARLARLEAQTRDQLVVLTVPDLRGTAIEAYGLAVGNGWQIGRKGLDNGVLLIVAPKERRVRIEVGCGLEGLLTPPRAAAIIDTDLVPRFKAGRPAAAVEAGVAAIDRLLRSDTRRPQRLSKPARI